MATNIAPWQPDPAGLREIVQTVHESTNTSVDVQREITKVRRPARPLRVGGPLISFRCAQKLNSFTRVPDYVAYLAYILAHMPEQTAQIRSIAAFLLKNNARSIVQTTSPAGVAFVKASVLAAFRDPSSQVRQAASQDVVSLLGILEPRNWPECLQMLVSTLDDENTDFAEVCGVTTALAPARMSLTRPTQAAFNALEKACEDYPKFMDIEIAGTRPMDYMVPKFLTLAEHPNPKMRSHAIACLSYFIPIGSQSLFAHLDAFIAALFKRASDDDPGVRRHVCQSLVLLLASRADRLLPEIGNVAEYMLYSTKDKNENVALEACEFWLTFAEEPDIAGYLAPLLPRVAPVLLDCMVYGEDDLLWLEGDVEDDAAVPDKVEDIKPRHYGSKAHGYEHDAAEQATQKKVSAYGEELADEDEDDFDDDDFDDEMTTEWNLRKCAAAALDVLAVRFGQDLLNVLLEPLKEKLWSSDWLQRESAILALGAMAEGKTPSDYRVLAVAHRWTGCIEVIEPHLTTLVPYLLNVLNDTKVRLAPWEEVLPLTSLQPLVRSIACWTLGRYASWCAHGASDEHKTTYFVPTLEGVRHEYCVLDPL
jgi:transportin-1